MNKIVQIEDIVPIIEEQLKSGGKVSFTPRGTSMLPLFRDNVDTVILATPEFALSFIEEITVSIFYIELLKYKKTAIKYEEIIR